MSATSPTSRGNPSRSFTFPRAFRLKRRRLIRALFDRNRDDVQSVAAGCVRVLYRMAPREEVKQPVPLQIAFAVSRRQVRRAVDRNSTKRLMREAFRLNKASLLNALEASADVLTLMVVFRGQPDAARTCIPRDLPRVLQRLEAALRPSPHHPPTGNDAPA